MLFIKEFDCITSKRGVLYIKENFQKDMNLRDIFLEDTKKA